MISFTMLKAKIAGTPSLNLFDPERPPVIVVYASKWEVSAALLQDHDNVHWPVIFTSLTLKPNENNYGMVEKKCWLSSGSCICAILCWLEGNSRS